MAKAEFAQEQVIQTSGFKDPFLLPHPGYMSTGFSAWHPGLDVATGLGMPIHPINSGKVVEVNFGFWGLGHSVMIEHEQGIKSTYGHLGRIFVKKDELVTQNSILGEVGMTGHTSGPHTHLEVTKNGQYLDPQLILPLLSKWPENAGEAPHGEGKIEKTEVKKELNDLVGIKVYQKEENKLKPLPLLLSPNVRP